MGQSFYELEIWKEGFRLLQITYRVTSQYPAEERYGLTDQTRRSSNSIIANIAEAHGRFHFADKIRVLYLARGELSETRSHLRVALSLGYLDQRQFDELEAGYQGLERGLNAMIDALHKRR